MPIRTATGRHLRTDDIGGKVLAHEHLRLDLRTDGDAEAMLHDTDAVTAELADARREHDLGLVIDLTCRGMRGDPGAVRRISEESGVEVVVATGWYYERFHPHGEPGTSVEDATEVLLADIRDGLQDGIVPGVLGEIGSHGEQASDAERIGLRASARAAVESGLSLGTHAHLGRGAREQLELLTGEGLPPHRISLGHQDLCEDGRQHRELARAGAYVAFDTVGKTGYQSDERRVELLLDLLEAGFERHILLSNDISRDSYLRYRGGQGYGYVLGPFRRMLIDRGVGTDVLDLIYRANALRWLTGNEEP
ncbi:hypothetical protein BHE97_11835 [Aeromicrobium sp. PE09-221]|uniref:phosphotriesterase family protein n=1 Tax=Aeromicrobium sp. PE09-221 TaxID=1898043 RepID=UPI000B3EA010|nr:hypothetical protein [Aeromicrobium sp. PE09-221]OUZ09044.1 hypothetical protein BHE97_11835 [Aeromicrobium sp. PE09-221]